MVTPSFTDTKRRKYRAQQVIRQDAPGDFAEGIVGEAEMLGGEIECAVKPGALGVGEVVLGLLQSGDMALAGAERACQWCVPACKL